MYNTTGLAVGLAIGLPAAIVFGVILAFWLRQRRRYRKDMEETVEADINEHVGDLDLEDLVDQTDSESQQNKRRENGKDVIRSNTYMIKKKDKVMGLKVVSKDSLNDGSYQHYYESVIPTLPNTADPTPEPRAGRSSSWLNVVDGTNNESSSPQKKNTRTTSVSSNNEFFKILHGDAGPIYPRPGSANGMIPAPGGSVSSSNNNSLSGSPHGSTVDITGQGVTPEHINSHYTPRKVIKQQPQPQQQHQPQTKTPLKQVQGGFRTSLELADSDEDGLPDEVGAVKSSPFDTPPHNSIV